VRKKRVEASREVEHRQIEAAFQEIIGGQLRGDAARVSTDPAAAGNGRGIDRKADRAGNRDLLVMRRAAWITDRPIRRLRSRLGIAMPLVKRVRRCAAAAGKVDRNQQVTFGAMAAEIARAAWSDADDRLQELEVDVAVAVIAQALGAKEELGTSRRGMAHGVDVAQVVFVRDVSWAERYAVDVVAILDRRREGGGIARCPAGRGVGGERVDVERARDPTEVRRRSRRQGWRAGRGPAAGARRSAIEEPTASGQIDRARRARRNG